MSGSRKDRGWTLRALFRPSFIGLFLLVQGCAAGGTDNPFTGTAADGDAYLLRVESRNTFEVEVYINITGERELIGTVSPRGLEFFEFLYPRGRPLSVELQTRLGDRYRVQGVPFPGGGRVDLIVGSNVRQSGFVRRNP